MRQRLATQRPLEDGNLASWRQTTIVLAFALLPPCCPALAGDAKDLPDQVRLEGNHWPGEGGRRIKIPVGIVLIDFARINLREESFDMAGYLDTSWTDPGLVLKPIEAKGKARRFRPGQIWAPALEFVNAVEQVVAEREGDLYVSDDGRVTQRIRFSHKFQSPLDLKRFPFDRQALSIVVAPFDPFARDLVLVVDPERVGRLEEASVPDWNIDGVNARLTKSRGGDPADKRFLFEVKVRRQF